MKFSYQDLPMVPQNRRDEFGKLADEMIDGLLSQAQIIQKAVSATGTGQKTFFRTTVTGRRNGISLKDETDHEVLIEWGKDEFLREYFRCFAVRGEMQSRDKSALLKLYASAGLGTVPVCIDAIRDGDGWQKLGLGFNVDFGFPLPIWLEAMAIEQKERG